jgi:CubicO group peptidase (beta-lactamase class C family)
LPGKATGQDRQHEPLVTTLRNRAHQLADSGDFAGEILLAYRGSTLYHEALGEIDPIAHVAAKIGDNYNIASVGKLFTGTAIVQLALEGRLSLDDTLGKFLADSIRPRLAGGVRLRHILSHTAGLRRGSDSLAFTPGTRFEYSNFGYYLLGRVVESVTGLPFDEHYRRALFSPNGMTSTFRYVPNSGRAAPPPGFAVARANGRRVFTENKELQTTPATGAGGFYSTAQDLFRFVEALRGGRVVPMEWVDSMRTPKANLGAADYGYGIDRYRGRNIWGNTGFIPGANADVEIYGDGGYVLVVLSNRAANEPIRQLVAESLGGEPFRTRG